MQPVRTSIDFLDAVRSAPVGNVKVVLERDEQFVVSKKVRDRDACGASRVAAL